MNIAGTAAKDLRLRDLKLYQKTGTDWKPIAPNTPTNEDDFLASKALTMLFFNVRSIAEEKGLVFANIMLFKIFDNTCLTETGLISEIPEKELHLGKHTMFEADGSTTN